MSSQTPVPARRGVGTGDRPLLGTAVVAFAFAVSGLLLAWRPVFGVAAALVGVVLGHAARSRLARDPRSHSGGGIAVVALVLGYLAIAASLLLVWVVTTAACYYGAHGAR